MSATDKWRGRQHVIPCVKTSISPKARITDMASSLKRAEYDQERYCSSASFSSISIFPCEVLFVDFPSDDLAIRIIDAIFILFFALNIGGTEL